MYKSWTIGNAIRKQREIQGIRQSQLCRGICSVPTLCRFENGERELDYFLTVVLMQRLGYGLDKYEFYGSNAEWIQWEQMCALSELRQKKEALKLQAALEDYKASWRESIEKSPVQKQFVRLTEGVLKKWEGDFKAAADFLTEAIGYTIPQWGDDWYEKTVVSQPELEIITELGNLYEKDKRQEEAWAIWRSVYEYMEKNKSRSTEMLSIYTSMTIKMVSYYFEKHCFQEGLALCDKALKKLSQCSRVYNWPELLYWKGRCKEQLMYRGEAHETEAAEIYKRAYYAARLFKQYDRADEIKRYFQKG